MGIEGTNVAITRCSILDVLSSVYCKYMLRKSRWVLAGFSFTLDKQS